jgi:hypothetical protein
MEGGFAQKDQESPVAVRQHTLGVHAGLHTVVDVIRDAVEVDDSTQDAAGIVGGLQQPRNHRGFPDPKQGGLLVGIQVGALPRFGPAFEGAPPVHELRVDRSCGCDQVGDLAGKAAGEAPVADVALRGHLPAVLDLADLGWLPVAGVGELAAGQAGVAAQITQPVTERFDGRLAQKRCTHLSDYR